LSSGAQGTERALPRGGHIRGRETRNAAADHDYIDFNIPVERRVRRQAELNPRAVLRYFHGRALQFLFQ